MSKTSLFEVFKVLAEYTDENHGLTNIEIREHLSKDQNVAMGWKGVTQSIKALESLGVEIKKTKSGKYDCFHLITRYFTKPELLVLLICVYSNHSIPIELSRTLTKKLLHTISCHERSKLNGFLHYTDCVKYLNDEVLNNIGVLNESIGEKKRIRFVYLTWSIKKILVPYHTYKYSYVTPMFIVLKNEKVYLVAWSERAGEIRHYRVDKISEISILDESATVNDAITGITNDQENYIKQNFSMFGGKKTVVVLEGQNDKIGILYDTFGTGIAVFPAGVDHFHAWVKVAVSNQFFGWIDSLERVITIAGPEKVLEDYQKHLNILIGGSEKV